MAARWSSAAAVVAALWAVALVGWCSAEDPYVYYDFDVSYITASPLGVEQQVKAASKMVPFFSDLCLFGLPRTTF